MNPKQTQVLLGTVFFCIYIFIVYYYKLIVNRGGSQFIKHKRPLLISATKLSRFHGLVSKQVLHHLRKFTDRGIFCKVTTNIYLLTAKILNCFLISFSLFHKLKGKNNTIVQTTTSSRGFFFNFL